MKGTWEVEELSDIRLSVGVFEVVGIALTIITPRVCLRGQRDSTEFVADIPALG